MRILIIGASGMLGKHLTEECNKVDIKFIGTYNNNPQNGLVKFDIVHDNISSVVSEEFIHYMGKKYAIICSALSKANYCSLNKDESYNLNVRYTKRVLDELKSLGLKPLFFSSTNVFDGKKGYYSEVDTVNPVNEYGRQKVEIENYIRDNFNDFLIIRLSKVISTINDDNNLIKELYSQIKDNITIRCVEGLCYSPTYAGDVAVSVLKALENDLNGIYHISNREIFTRDEMVRQFSYYLGKECDILLETVEKFGFIEPFPLKNYLDSSKFIEVIPMNYSSYREVFINYVSKMG